MYSPTEASKELYAKWNAHYVEQGNRRIPIIAAQWAYSLKTLTEELHAVLDFALEQSVTAMKAYPLNATEDELDLAVEGLCIGYFGEELRQEWRNRRVAFDTLRPPPMTSP